MLDQAGGDGQTRFCSAHFLDDELRDDRSNRISPRVTLALATVYGNRELAPMRQSAPSIVQHDIDDSRIISTADAQEILERKYQNRYELEDDSDAVDNYMSLTTYGTFTCCNGAINIGQPSLDMPTLINRLVGAERKRHTCSMYPCLSSPHHSPLWRDATISRATDITVP